MRNTSHAAVILTMGCAAALARAAMNPQYADQVKQYQQSADWNTNWMNDQLNTAQQAGAFARPDLPAFQAFMHKLIGAWGDAAKALQANDQAKANDLAGKARDLEAVRNVWGERIGVRAHEAQIAPTEAWYDDLTRWVKPEIAADVAEAKKHAVAANSAYADALVPGADPRKLAALHTAAEIAEGDEQVAEMEMYWHNDDANLIKDTTLTSPELAKTTAALEAWRKARVAAFQQMLADQRKLEQIDDQRDAINDARYQAYYKAYDARQRGGR